MTGRATCSVCGQPADGTRELTAVDRARWPSVAAWIRFACADCRRGFRRRHPEKAKAAA